MAIKLRYYAKLNENGLNIHDRIGFMEAVKKFGDKGFWLSVNPVKKWHSDQQRSYYFGVVVKLLSEYTGDTMDEMHEILKRLFLSKKVERFGWAVFLCGSTKLLSKGEFAEYINKCIDLATEYGVVIPTPEEYYQNIQVRVSE